MSINVGFGSFGGHSGSAPAPFDAMNGFRLAGPQGSHPLHAIRAEDLLRSCDGPVSAQFVLDAQPRVGDGITGRVRLVANEPIAARKAYLRLVGLRLDEERRSHEDRDSEGRVTHREEWVEANGKLFVTDAFLEPVVPTTLEPGQVWESTFMVPAPRLGPPSAHLGESIIAWALEVRWDIPHGSDHFAACFLPLAQHPDLMRAGVGKQGGQSLLEGVPAGDAMITVASPLPAVPGSEMIVRVNWPSAPGGQGARIELHRRTNAPNGVEGIVASGPVQQADLKSGAAEAHLLVPPDAAPSFDGAGLEINYVIRVLIDRRLRPDAAIERPVGIC